MILLPDSVLDEGYWFTKLVNETPYPIDDTLEANCVAQAIVKALKEESNNKEAPNPDSRIPVRHRA